MGALTKFQNNVFTPAIPEQTPRAASITCPQPVTPPVTPPQTGNGLHGCYTTYKLQNSITGQTATATVAPGIGVPPQYNTTGWGVVSFTEVCYP